jgi:hypothetical protein
MDDGLITIVPKRSIRDGTRFVKVYGPRYDILDVTTHGDVVIAIESAPLSLIAAPDRLPRHRNISDIFRGSHRDILAQYTKRCTDKESVFGVAAYSYNSNSHVFLDLDGIRYELQTKVKHRMGQVAQYYAFLGCLSQKHPYFTVHGVWMDCGTGEMLDYPFDKNISEQLGLCYGSFDPALI